MADERNYAVRGYLSRASDVGPTRYRLHPLPEQRTTYLEFDATAVDTVSGLTPDGRVEVRFKLTTNLRHAVDTIRTARLLSGAQSSPATPSEHGLDFVANFSCRF